MDFPGPTGSNRDESPVRLLAGEVGVQPSDGLPIGGQAGDLLSAAWRRAGLEGVRHLDGVFACVATTAGEQWVYRDPSGLCALFACRLDDSSDWQVLTDLQQAQTLMPGPAQLDRTALHEYLRLMDIASPRTIVRGAVAIEPGLWTKLTPAGVLSPAGLSEKAGPWSAGDLEQAVEHLQNLLQASVAAGLGAAAKPGAFLSGGIDSALVCALAARQRPDTTSVTVGFEGQRFDESDAAARIAQHLGLRHQVLRFSRLELLNAFQRMAEGMDQPMADPATLVTVLAFDHCRQHFDVVLDGTGADEAVGAMPARHQRWAVGFGSVLPAAIRRWLVRGMKRVPGLAGYIPVFDFEHPAETLMRWKGFTRVEIEELCGEPVSLEDTAFYRTFARYPRHAHYERFSALNNAMPCDRLTQATKLSGATVRYPFCARGVDSFLRQLPTEWRYLPGQPKRILRELLARYVPRNLWDIPKHSFDFPLQHFLAGDNYMLVHKHVLQGRWLQRGLLRPQVVQRYAHQYLAGDQRLMFRVWALVVLGAWLDEHEDLI